MIRARRIRSVAWGAIGVVTAILSWSGAVTTASGITCSLAPVAAASAGKDVLSGVAPLGRQTLIVGTRYLGSEGGPLAVTTDGTTWSARVIPGFQTASVQLEDVVVAGGRAWAVGAVADVAPAVVAWDGRWRVVPIADPGPDEDGLSAVAASGPSVVWAVGRHQVGKEFVPLVERWDGAVWQRVSTPTRGASSILNDVVATGPTDLWAVGWSVDHGRYSPLVLRGNGSTWTISPTPAPGAGDALLTGLAARGAHDVWAVGWTRVDGAVNGLVEHWDGRRWAVVAMPQAEDVELMDVATLPHGVAVAGRGSNATQPAPWAALDVDGTWSIVPASTTGPSWFNAVAAGGDGRVWAVGTTMADNATAKGLAANGCAGA